MFTLLSIASHCFPITPVISALVLPPPLLIANSYSVLYPHTLSPLNYDGYHGSTLCPPSIMMPTMAPSNIPPSIMMYPMAPSNLYPLNDDVSLIMNILWWGDCLCTKWQLDWLEDDWRVHTRRGRIRRNNNTLATSLAHPWSRQFLLIPLQWYPYPTSFKYPTWPFAYLGQ